MEDNDYVKSIFDIIDGRIKFKDIDKKKRGRKPGYTHSKETRDKIAGRMKGRSKDEKTREKISRSLQGREKPIKTRKKISKSRTHNSVAGDLLEQYSGLTRERDIPTTTHEYLAKMGYNPIDIIQWVKDNFEDINEGQGPDDDETRTIRWEAALNAKLRKEDPNLDDIGLIDSLWRPND